MGLSLPKCAPVRLQVESLEERLALASTTNPAVVPTPGLARWLARQLVLENTPKGNPPVVFLGDSILARFEHGPGAPVWWDTIAPYGAADYAIGGSETENVLWEIHQGQLNGITPSVIVLMIGSNNLAHGQSPGQTAAGVAACVANIQAKLPAASILLLGILPRGRNWNAPLRAPIVETNSLIAQLANGSSVTFLDAGGLFLDLNGTIPTALMPEAVHPSRQGYQLLSAALQQPLQQLLAGAAAPQTSLQNTTP
jgi:lysophospholipase L1-like esterase